MCLCVMSVTADSCVCRRHSIPRGGGEGRGECERERERESVFLAFRTPLIRTQHYSLQSGHNICIRATAVC